MEEVPLIESFPTRDSISEIPFDVGSLVTIIVYSMLMTFSAIGNITFLSITLKRRRTLSSGINKMFVHLAIADLLVTFLVIPMEIVLAITVPLVAKDPTCRIASFFRIFVFYLSSFILVSISIDRCYAVFKPKDLSGSNNKAKEMMNWSWLASIILSAPQLIDPPVVQHDVYTSYEQCTTYNVFMNDAYKVEYALSILILSFILPLVVITSSYIFIFCKIYCCSKKGQAKSRTLKMTITIVAVFVICWFPYYVVVFWYWLNPDSTKNVDIPIQKGLFFFACTNSAMNPIVYGAFYIDTCPTAPIQIIFRGTSNYPKGISQLDHPSSSSNSSQFLCIEQQQQTV